MTFWLKKISKNLNLTLRLSVPLFLLRVLPGSHQRPDGGKARQESVSSQLWPRWPQWTGLNNNYINIRICKAWEFNNGLLTGIYQWAKYRLGYDAISQSIVKKVPCLTDSY